MKKQNLLKSLILVMAVLFGTGQTFASTSVVQTFSVSAQPTVAITKTSNSDETGDINPETGSHLGLSASFNLQTNGTDENYIFIVGSKITAYGGQEVSAFTSDGKGLLFGRIGDEEHFPSTTAIENARSGGSNNPNVIVYPISTMSITAPMTVQYDETQATDEGTGCYVVKLNGGTEGTLRQEIGGSAASGSYSVGQDMAGRYKAVVYFTAINK